MVISSWKDWCDSHVSSIDEPHTAMTIPAETIEKLCRLAQLAMPPEEREALVGDLGRIIDMVDAMAAVDTEGVEPMTSVVDTTPTQRDDVVNDGGYPERVLANAPAAADGFFTVPKVVE